MNVEQRETSERPTDSAEQGTAHSLSGKLNSWPKKQRNSYEFITPTDLLVAVIKRISKFVYDANPFYLISAALILYSLTIYFKTGNIWIENGIPLAIIAAYAVLMTGTALLIVRLGRVWEDARSILIIILFLFLALSFSMDGIVMQSFGTCSYVLAGGLGLIIALSETLHLGLKIRLPRLVRASYYTVFALFFGHQYVMGYLWTLRHANKWGPVQANEIISQAVSVFPILAAVALALLIPVIRKGRRLIRNNGTPWAWPLFPWNIFAILGLGICFRTYFMCISFTDGQGVGTYSNMENGFGMYMLFPIFLVGMILFLEHTLAIRKRLWQMRMLLAPLLFFACALPYQANLIVSTKMYKQHLEAVAGPDGSEMMIALVVAMMFYCYAWLRRVRYADTTITGLLLIASLVNINHNYLSYYHLPATAPLLVMVVMLGLITYRHRHSSWALLTAGALVFALCIEFRNTWFTAYHGAIPLHLSYVSLIVVSFLFKDELARALGFFAAILLPFMFIPALFFSASLAPGLHGGIVAIYLVSLLVLSAVGYRLLENRTFLIAGLVNLTSIGFYMTINGLKAVHQVKYRGAGWIFWSSVFFLIALGISLWKAGILQRLSHGVHSMIRRQLHHFHS